MAYRLQTRKEQDPSWKVTIEGQLEDRVTALRDESEETSGEAERTARPLEERCLGSQVSKERQGLPATWLSKQRKAHLFVGAGDMASTFPK